MLIPLNKTLRVHILDNWGSLRLRHRFPTWTGGRGKNSHFWIHMYADYPIFIHLSPSSLCCHLNGNLDRADISHLDPAPVSRDSKGISKLPLIQPTLYCKISCIRGRGHYNKDESQACLFTFFPG